MYSVLHRISPTTFVYYTGNKNSHSNENGCFYQKEFGLEKGSEPLKVEYYLHPSVLNISLMRGKSTTFFGILNGKNSLVKRE